MRQNHPDSHGFYFPENGQGPLKNSIRMNSNNVLELDCVYDPKQYDVNNLTGRDAWPETIKLLT